MKRVNIIGIDLAKNIFQLPELSCGQATSRGGNPVESTKIDGYGTT